MANGKNFYMVVHIKTHDRQDKQEAHDRLYRWLETFGYTSIRHGFEFIEVMQVTERGKRVRRKNEAKGTVSRIGHASDAVARRRS